jgi:hypothetical protein
MEPPPYDALIVPLSVVPSSTKFYFSKYYFDASGMEYFSIDTFENNQ